MARTWTQADRDQIAVMLQEGKSASQIAAAFEGTSRNAVIGIVHRDPRLAAIGFTRRPSENDNVVRGVAAARENKGKGGVRTVVATGTIRAIRSGVRLDAPWDGGPHVAGITLDMLTARRCRWPINDPEPGTNGFLFCGHRATLGKSYCEHHHEASVGEGTASERGAVRSALRAAG